MPQAARLSPSLFPPPTLADVSQRAPAARRTSFAFFLAGFATFSMLYCVQPLLPLFTAEFHVSAVQSSLALSLTTGLLSVAILGAAVLSETVGRRGLIFASMSGAALLNLAAAAAPGWTALLVLRAAEGIVLGGVPAVAMTYLSEEIDASRLGSTMGLYVGGTAFGGMAGRMGTGILAQEFGWRVAIAGISLAGMAAALAFVLLVPPSRNFLRRPGFQPRFHLGAWAGHLRRRELALLYACGFLAMGAFVTVYNYAGFRLMRPPYGLSQTALGLIFGVYLFGIAASSLAGTLAVRWGRAVTLCLGFAVTGAGVLLTLCSGLVPVVLGIVVLTVGFFLAHSTASSWVGRLALQAKGHASSLYLLTYYLGSSVAGSVGGHFWASSGWHGVIAFTSGLVVTGLLACALLLRTERAMQSQQ